VQESHAGHLRKSRYLEQDPASPGVELSEEVCTCGNTFASDAVFCRICGNRRSQQVAAAGFSLKADTIGLPIDRLSEPAQEPPTAPERVLTPVEDALASPRLASPRWGKYKDKDKDPDDDLKASANAQDSEKDSPKKFGAKKKKAGFQKAQLDETKQLLGESSSTTVRFKKEIDDAGVKSQDMSQMSPTMSTMSKTRSSRVKGKAKSRPRWKKDKAGEAQRDGEMAV